MGDATNSSIAANNAPYYHSFRKLSHTDGSSTDSFEAQADDYEPAAIITPYAPVYTGLASNGADTANGFHGQDQLCLHHSTNSGEHEVTDTPELAGLLQAVTSAVGEERIGTYKDIANDGLRNAASGQGDGGAPVEPAAVASRKRKRKSLADQSKSQHLNGLSNTLGEGDNMAPIAPYSQRKRTRRSDADSDSNAVTTSPRAIPNIAYSNGSKGSDADLPNVDSNTPTMSDSRFPGAHCAATLFRQTTSNGRKYTRPPMSQMFYSMQLDAESFLHLQAATKSYMLDAAHPERLNCVGNRGKGDNDMVKLRLFNCVNEFLREGAGEQFFGLNAAGRIIYEKNGGEMVIDSSNRDRCFNWPRDAGQIVALVTPLMRRMITNERQRMYAVEVRKGGSGNSNSSNSNAATALANRMGGVSNPQISVPLSESSAEEKSHVHGSTQTLQHAALGAIAQEAKRVGLNQTRDQFPVMLNDSHKNFNTLDPTLPAAITTSTMSPGHQAHSLFDPSSPQLQYVRIFVIRNSVQLLPATNLAYSEDRPVSFAELETFVTEQLVANEVITAAAAAAILERRNTQSASNDDDNAADTTTTHAMNGHSPHGSPTSHPHTHTHPHSRQQQQQGPINLQGNGTEGSAPANGSSIPTSSPRNSGSSAESELVPRPLFSRVPTGPVTMIVRAQTTHGLIHVNEDSTWQHVKADVLSALYMEGVVRVVVQVM